MGIGKNALNVHLTDVPYLKAAGELKTKAYPTLRQGTAERRYSARHLDSPHRETSRRGHTEESWQVSVM